MQALTRASPAQKKILEDNYAQKDDANVAKVKQLYKELDLEKVFKDYEEESYARYAFSLPLLAQSSSLAGVHLVVCIQSLSPTRGGAIDAERFNFSLTTCAIVCVSSRLQTLITDKVGDLPKGIFTDFAQKIYKRIL
jgi:hypothetical protein